MTRHANRETRADRRPRPSRASTPSPGLSTTDRVVHLVVHLVALPMVVLGVVLGVLLAGLVSSLLPATPAHAAEPDTAAAITVASMSPTIITDRARTDTLITIRGTVRNTGPQPIRTPQVFFWRSLKPITSAAALRQAQESDATDPEGARVTERSVDLFSAAAPELAPGGSRRFTITVTLGELQLPRIDGVYLVGVQLRADMLTTPGRVRLFLPVSDAGSAVTARNTVKMASLVLLSSRPALLFTSVPARDDRDAVDAVFADDHLATDVAPGGRLAALLQDAGRPGVSVAVDPDLVAELEQMARGYTLRSTDGRTTPGTGATRAARWLAQLDAVLTRQDSYRLPYATLDLAALAHSGRSSVVLGSEQAAAAVERTAKLPLLAFPADGLADRATLDAAATLRPRAYLLSDAVTDGRGPLLTGPHGIPVVSFTSTSTTGGPGPDPSDTATHRRQAFLATSWVEQAGSAPGTSLGSVRLVTEPGQAGAAEVAAAPWIRRTTLGDLLTGTPRAGPPSLVYPVTGADAELTARQLAAVSAVAARQQTYSRLVDADDGAAVVGGAAARAASSAWRGQARASRPWTNAQLVVLRADLEHGVSVSGGPEPKLTTRNSVFPLIVTNRLDRSVTVVLGFDTTNPQRLSIAAQYEPPGRHALTLAPGESRQLTNQAVARTNGTFPVTARLATLDGDPVGQPYAMQVHAANVGLVGWVIVVASGLTLVGATVFRIRQVARERGGSGPAGHEPDAGEGTGTDPADGPGPGSARTRHGTSA